MTTSAFAQVASPIANVTPSTQTALNETKCLNGRGRGHATIELTGRKEIKGEHIGVTSHGDVAVISNNKTLRLFVCYRDKSGRQGTVNNINLLDAGRCSVGEIASLNLFMDNGDNFVFRSIAYNPETSLCIDRKLSLSFHLHANVLLSSFVFNLFSLY